MKLWTVDAFTNQAFKGNPAAVIPVDQFPPDDLCQKIAFELNLSETAFVECRSDTSLRIRWFTPTVEVKLCGHATLAAAHILFQEKIVLGDQLEFQSLSGPLRVKKIGRKLTLDFPLQTTGPDLPRESFQKILNQDLVHAVQAFDDLILVLEDEDRVREFHVAPARLAELDYRGVIVTAKGKSQYDFVSRFFAPRVGIDEDPVTGSAHCKLAHYWGKKLKKDKFFAFQASPRGGELEIEISGDRVFLTGEAVTVLQGSLLL